MLIQLSHLLQQVSNRKSFLFLLAAYSIYFPIFFFADVPFGLTSILPYSHGTTILDVELFYNAEQAYQRLNLFGEEGRAAYFNILMGDLLYPLFLSGLLSVSITLLFLRLKYSHTSWQYLGLLPLAILFFDYLESALLLSLLHYYPIQLPIVASLAGYITFTKNMFGMLSFMVLGWGLFAQIPTWFRKRFSP